MPTFTINLQDLDWYSRQSYEIFVLNQPQIKSSGLFKRGLEHFIVCPEITSETLAIDGTLLENWFRNNKILTSPIKLSNKIPNGAFKVQARTQSEIISQSGEAKNLRMFRTDLIWQLGREFPEFTIQDTHREPGVIELSFKHPLTNDQKTRLEKALTQIAIPANYRISDDPSLDVDSFEFRYKDGMGDIDLIPSKFIRFPISKKLHNLWEKDEDLWLSNRHLLLSGKVHEKNDFLDSSLQKRDFCIIDASVFPNINLRNYFTIYKRVLMVMPIGERLPEIIKSFSVTESELVLLAKEGKLVFLLPQSLDRYDQKLLSDIAEANPSSLIFSRKISALSIIENHKRFPLLYTNLTIDEKSQILSVFHEASISTSNDSLKNIIQATQRSLSRIWLSNGLINFRGAMGTPVTSLASLFADTLTTTSLKKFDFEFMVSAFLVDIGAAFNGPIFPVEAENYSQYPFSQMLAAGYSTFSSAPIIASTQNLDLIFSELFTLNNNQPILDFINGFEIADIMRLRELIYNVDKLNLGKEELKQRIEAFNKEIKRVEGHNERLNSFDLKGLIRGAATITGGALNYAGYKEAGLAVATVPLFMWVIDRLESLKSKDVTYGTLADSLKARSFNSSVDSVFVARIRKQYSI